MPIRGPRPHQETARRRLEQLAASGRGRSALGSGEALPVHLDGGWVPPPPPQPALDQARSSRGTARHRRTPGKALPPVPPTGPAVDLDLDQDVLDAGDNDDGLWPEPIQGGRARWAPSAAALVGVLVVVLAVVAGLALRGLTSDAGNEVEALPQRTGDVGQPTSPTSAPTSDLTSNLASAPVTDASPTSTAATGQQARAVPATEVAVHVVGAVQNPGLVRLPPGARALDAVEAAGGASEDADLVRVNLARSVVDGEQLVVPRPGDPDPTVATGPAAASGTATGDGASSPRAEGAAEAPAALVDLNTAGLAELDTLPGVGPVLAQRILDWRDQQGGFTDVAELAEVSGIGDAKLADLTPLVQVGPG